jgi:hypothetical protein
MDMGKPSVRLAAEAAVRSKAPPVVVVAGYKRAARSRRRWRTSTSPAGALQVVRVAEESERARSCFNGRIRWAAASDDRREARAYSIAFPGDKVLAHFPGKIMVKPSESYPYRVGPKGSVQSAVPVHTSSHSLRMSAAAARSADVPS